MSQLEILSQNRGFGVSDKYKVINTNEVLSQFENAGFEVQSISKAAVRTVGKDGFQKHLIRLSHPDTNFKIEGLRPEIILKNAYDGTTCFNLRIGVYRFLCANGLEVGTSFTDLSVKHIGQNVLSKVIENARIVMKQFPEMQAQIEELQAKQLTQSEIVQFAELMGQYLVSKRNNVKSVDASNLLTFRRSEDQKNDAFTILNVIQENSLKGSYKYVSEVKEKNSDTTKLITRNGSKIRSIDKTSQINTKVWDLASSFLNVA